jgi:response regulator of citrate/malate metabolism
LCKAAESSDNLRSFFHEGIVGYALTAVEHERFHVLIKKVGVQLDLYDLDAAIMLVYLPYC